MATIIGGTWSQTLLGTDGNDTIDGRGGNDTIDGGGGTDTAIFFSNRANFTITDLSGVTRLYGNSSAGAYAYDEVFLTNVEQLQFADAIAAVKPNSNNLVIGGTWSQTLLGTGGNDTIDGRGGNDTINGGGGTDTAIFFSNRANFTITDLSGVARLYGNSSAGAYAYDEVFLTNVEQLQFADATAAVKPNSNNLVIGGTWSQTLLGTGGNDTIDGRGGNDTIDGGGGTDTAIFFSNRANFTITDLSGVARLYGNSSAGAYAYDEVFLTNVEQLQFADAIAAVKPNSNNLVIGGTWSQTLLGTGGNDTIDGRGGNDTIDGGGGTDTAIFFSNRANFTITDLSGVTRLYGNSSAGAYAYDEVFLTNVERLQFADTATLIDDDGAIGILDAWSKPVALAQLPLAGPVVVTQGYGGDTSHGNQPYSVDFRASSGNDIYSVANGKVVGIRTGSSGIDTGFGGYGNYITILHDGGIYATYAHLSSISVSLNQSIKSGMNIGKSGSSGGYDIDGSGPKLANGYPAHLHITFGTALVHDIGDTDRADGSTSTGSPAFFLSFFTAAELMGSVNPADTAKLLSTDIFGTADATDDINGGDSDDDELKGSESANRIFGGSGNDRLIGLGEKDTLVGGTGSDSMIGGDGSDIYYVDHAGDVVTETNAAASTGGTDSVYSSLGSYTLGANVENGRIMATGAANLIGNGLNNVLYAGAGNNVLHGGAGSDTVDYSYATSAVRVNLGVTIAQATAGSGSDTLISIEGLTGSRYNDLLIGNTVANVLNGHAGADRMFGGNGSDIYYVDHAGDVVTETNATASTGGTDSVYSSLGSYTLGVNVENGRIMATGAANLIGNGLNNVLYAGAGNNVLHGGAGSDTVDYSYATSAVKVNLGVTIAQATAGSGSDTLIAIERLTGSKYNDVLSGSTGNNKINGGAGNDILSGAAGLDIFRFSNALSATANVDTIKGFASVDDSIELENAVFTKLSVVGALAAANFKANTTGRATDSNDYVVYETDTGRLFYDADGSGAGVSVMIATLTGAPTLTTPIYS